MSGLSGARNALVRMGAYNIPSSNEMEQAEKDTVWPKDGRGTAGNDNLWTLTKTGPDDYWIHTDRNEEEVE